MVPAKAKQDRWTDNQMDKGQSDPFVALFLAGQKISRDMVYFYPLKTTTLPGGNRH